MNNIFMQAYIAVSYSKRKFLTEELKIIKQILGQCNIDPFVFADTYNFKPAREKQMMQQAFAAIDACDLLIAETSDKAIGIGIEVGYAKAKGKSIIYLRNNAAEHSTTVSGASDYKIVYNDVLDLSNKLKKVFLIIYGNRIYAANKT
jgi:2'-deoxynucleoside 5'-phosphate N-hydrolase